MKKEKIFVIDDEPAIREMLRMILEYEGYDVEDLEDGPLALQRIREGAPDAVLLDIKMPGMDGMEVLERIKEFDVRIPVVMLTGHGTIETAVEATKKGAYDFLPKPPDREKILITLRNALRQTSLLRENLSMKRALHTKEVMIGESLVMRQLAEAVERVARTEAFVLITGENGTGKELVAKALHRLSLRQEKPYVDVNCAAIPNELIESELFGHEKGSFTGATAQRIGKFELADTGTLFLDEIGDMSLAAQAKVLRVLEDGAFERVGGSKKIHVDVRVIAATNKRLTQEIKEQRFREDLYHRLNVIQFQVPALRDRREDVPLLVRHFLTEVCEKNKLTPRTISEDALIALRNFPWPGNVRELRNAVERLAIMSGGCISKGDVDRYVTGSTDESESLFSMDLSFQEFKDKSESMFLERQLEKYQWNISKTADMLDIQRSHLYTKMSKYHLNREQSQG
jgi:two-component system, NtrC family, nitrogen regulation response regulator NtrX